jgi:hypothetical protein
MGHSSPSGDGMTERGYDALLSSAEGIASDYRREPVKAVPLDPDAPAAAPQHGEKSPALIVKRLGVAYRPTPGIKLGARAAGSERATGLASTDANSVARD